MSGQTFYECTLSRGYWAVSNKALTQLLFTIKFIVLLRVLGVADVGLVRVAGLNMNTLNSFTGAGFHKSLVQEKGDIRTCLSAAWSLGIVRGIILYLMMYFAAPFIVQLEVPPEKRSRFRQFIVGYRYFFSTGAVEQSLKHIWILMDSSQGIGKWFLGISKWARKTV